MYHDIDAALEGWDYKPGVVQARLVQARGGRQVIQLRVDLGIFQLETSGRPDGTRPHGCQTYCEYLIRQAQVFEKTGQNFTLSEEQCVEADREFVQYYQRRMCWLALRNYAAAVADADHTLAFMDFVGEHSPSEEYRLAHEQYRGFVLFQRTQAGAALALEKQTPEEAIDVLAAGLTAIRSFLASNGVEEEAEQNEMVQHLVKMEENLRKSHGIGETLHEQLERAIANEDYERAARIRDALRSRQEK
jgi:hypothetical protein